MRRMNKKGITPIIAVVLLLMMTVAAAGAAFYWLNRMQQQVQSGVSGTQQQMLEQSAASVAQVSKNYDSTNNNLSVDVQNTGSKTVSLSKSDIVAVIEDTDGNAECAASALDSATISGGTDDSSGDLTTDEVSRIWMNVTSCGGIDASSGETFYYSIRFEKGATVSGSFET